MVGWLGGFMLVCGLGGLGVLLLAVGFPCPLGLVGVCPLLCVGVIPLGWLSGCWWRVGSDACWSGWLLVVILHGIGRLSSLRLAWRPL